MLLFLLGSKAQGQTIQAGNTFAESEVVSDTAIPTISTGEPGIKNEMGDLEGADPDPVPVDNFIPLLFSFALGLIFYKRRRILKFGL